METGCPDSSFCGRGSPMLDLPCGKDALHRDLPRQPTVIYLLRRLERPFPRGACQALGRDPSDPAGSGEQSPRHAARRDPRPLARGGGRPDRHRRRASPPRVEGRGSGHADDWRGVQAQLLPGLAGACRVRPFGPCMGPRPVRDSRVHPRHLRPLIRAPRQA